MLAAPSKTANRFAILTRHLGSSADRHYDERFLPLLWNVEDPVRVGIDVCHKTPDSPVVASWFAVRRQRRSRMRGFRERPWHQEAMKRYFSLRPIVTDGLRT